MNKKLILWTKNWAKKYKMPILFQDSAYNSNVWAKALNLKSKEQLLIFAGRQTNPRGRNKKKWIESCFMGSWTWVQDLAVYPALSPLIGLQLYQACLSAWPKLPWALKAPNDIFLNEKKTAGLLVEAQSQGNNTQVIVGLGMNVFRAPDLTQERVGKNLKNNDYSAGYISFYNNILEENWATFLNSFSKNLHSLKKKSLSLKPALNQYKALTTAKHCLQNSKK